MARADTPEEGAPPAQASTTDMFEDVRSTRFKVYNRVAATKPLNPLMSLLRLIPKHPTLQSDGADKARTDTPDDFAYLQVAAAFKRNVFGIRLGMHVEISEDVFVVDGAVEYAFDEAPQYRREDLEEFVRAEAAPRVSIATLTILEEVARSAGADLTTELEDPSDMVAESVMQQFDSFHAGGRGAMTDSQGTGRSSETDDDIEWDEEHFPLGKGTEDDPVYKAIGDSFGSMFSGQPLRLAMEAAGPGVITLDMRDADGELVQLDPSNAVALARRLLMAAMYWIDMHGIGDREQVVEVMELLNASLGLDWQPYDPDENPDEP